MFRIYALILCFFICLQGFGQQFAPVETYLVDSLDLENISQQDRSLIDSSLVSYRTCTDDICRIVAISDIVEKSWDNNVWPKYNQWVHDYISDILLEDHDSLTLATLKMHYAGALNNIGYLHNVKGENDKALMFFEKCLGIQREIDDKPGMSGTLINMAFIFLNQGSIERALDNYYSSLSIEEEIQNRTGMATALNGIGFVFYKQGDNDQALTNYTKSLVIRRELKDDYGTATCLNNIGLLFRDQEKWDKALNYYQQCLALEEKLADKDGMGITYANIGFVYESQGEYNKAFDNYKKSLDIRRNSQNQQGIASALNYLAGLESSRGNLIKAKNYALQGLDIGRKLNYPALIRDAAETLSNVTKKQNQWKEALLYYELHVQMKDSIFNEETIRASVNQRYRYNYEKRTMADSIKNANEQRILDAELVASEAETSRLQLQSTKQRQQAYFLMAGILVALSLSTAIYNRMRVIRGQNETIASQKHELEEQKEDLEHLNEDLTHFAHTVSHDLKTPLVGMVGLAQLIEMEHPHLDHQLKEKLDMLKDSALKSRDLVNGILAYSEAGRKGLDTEQVELGQLIESIIHGIKNDNEVRITTTDLPSITCNEYQFRQILTNLISNAVKYNHRNKGEGRVDISYSNIDGFHQFSVSDNGPGIPESSQAEVFEIFRKVPNSDVEDSNGVGLSIVKKLVTQNGGIIDLQSTEGQGATFTFTWPK